MIGPAISEISSTNEVKKPDMSVQVERLALCPAHRGRRSDRPAASAGIARFLTRLRCKGYGRTAVPSWFSSCSKRLWIPRASLPVKPFVRVVCPPFFLVKPGDEGSWRRTPRTPGIPFLFARPLHQEPGQQLRRAHLSLTGTVSLVPQITDKVKVPVIAAGVRCASQE